MSDNLVLTYDNTALTDGVGAQLHRIYGLWAVSRLVGVPYLHSPIARIGYQGLDAMQAHVSDPNFPDEFNDLCRIDSDPVATHDFHAIKLRNIHLGHFRLFDTLVDRGATGGKPGLLRVTMPHGVADQFPDCYEACKQISPFASPARDSEELRVAIHVRRGEQLLIFSDRLLPNAYYINVAFNVARVLDTLGVKYKLELWTEVPTTEFTVYPDQLRGRISGPVMVTPDMYGLDDFEVLPNLVHCINGKTIDCLRNLATADILIMSRSSFSYVAAVLNRNGTVMYHPFWHSPLSSWITVHPDGRFDRSALRRAVTTPTG